MANITINENVFSQQINDDATIVNFIDYVTNENINTSGHVVTEVFIDNESIDFHYENPELDRKMSEISTLDIKTKSSLQLSFEALESMPLYIDNITEQIHGVIENFRAGEAEQGNLLFADTINTIELFIQLFTGVQNSFVRNLGNKYKKTDNLIQCEGQLLEIVKEIIDSKTNNDDTLLCDLLEYELVANLKQWKDEIIPELISLKRHI